MWRPLYDALSSVWQPACQARASSYAGHRRKHGDVAWKPDEANQNVIVPKVKISQMVYWLVCRKMVTHAAWVIHMKPLRWSMEPGDSRWSHGRHASLPELTEKSTIFKVSTIFAKREAAKGAEKTGLQVKSSSVLPISLRSATSRLQQVENIHLLKAAGRIYL